MTLGLHGLDAEIAEVEAKIAAEKLALEDALAACTDSVRDVVASPKTLLALTGVGFAAGKLMFGRREPEPKRKTPAKKAGLLSLLTGVAGTALGIMQPKFGWGTIAKWAGKRAWTRYRANRASAAAATAKTKPATTATPPGVASVPYPAPSRAAEGIGAGVRR